MSRLRLSKLNKPIWIIQLIIMDITVYPWQHIKNNPSGRIWESWVMGSCCQICTDIASRFSKSHCFYTASTTDVSTVEDLQTIHVHINSSSGLFHYLVSWITITCHLKTSFMVYVRSKSKCSIRYPTAWRWTLRDVMNQTFSIFSPSPDLPDSKFYM